MNMKWFHVFFFRLMIDVVGLIFRPLHKYRYVKADYSRIPPKTPLLVISNHTSALDPAWVGSSFYKHLYFVASEHIFRMDVRGPLLRFFCHPIIQVRGRTDFNAVREMLKRLHRGDNVCLFVEGNLSFSGVTGPFPKGTGKLIKVSGAALVTYRVRGGYFRTPRWGRKRRNGPIYGAAVGYYAPQELKNMTSEEINGIIQRDIYEDAYATMEANPRAYPGEGLAEHLETALYLCPSCGRIAKLSSKDDKFFCECGLSVRYDEYGQLHIESPGKVSADHAPGYLHEPFTTVRDWWYWQEETMAEIVAAAGDGPICTDDDEALYQINVGSHSTIAAQGILTLGKSGLCCGQTNFTLNEIADLAIVSSATLGFSVGNAQYELKNKKPRSAAKYQRVFELLTGTKKD
jgi:hypothetical protein